jgi:hypothetical protein
MNQYNPFDNSRLLSDSIRSFMKAQDFKNLNHEHKVRLVWTKGKFVSKRYVKNQTIVLYSLHNFFVELFYDNFDNRLIRLERTDLDEVAKNYC